MSQKGQLGHEMPADIMAGAEARGLLGTLCPVAQGELVIGLRYRISDI